MNGRTARAGGVSAGPKTRIFFIDIGEMLRLPHNSCESNGPGVVPAGGHFAGEQDERRYKS